LQQRYRETLFDEALAYALDRALAEVECARRPLVRAALLGLGLIHLQQHAGMSEFARARLALRNHRLQFLPLLRRERHAIFLGHGPLPW
jgi:hypothetical protein